MTSVVNIGPVTSVVRIFRIGRVFRLFAVRDAFLISLPQLVNVGCILSLLLCLYAVLGMTVDDRGNLRSFYGASMTLCRCITGEAWNDIMHALGKDGKFRPSWIIAMTSCVPELAMTTDLVQQIEEATLGGFEEEAYSLVNQCGTSVLAQVSFLTFTMLVTFICLNLVTVVVLEGFEEEEGDHPACPSSR